MLEKTRQEFVFRPIKPSVDFSKKLKKIQVSDNNYPQPKTVNLGYPLKGGVKK